MSRDLDVRGLGCPGTWMSGDLDVPGPGCPGTWMSRDLDVRIPKKLPWLFFVTDVQWSAAEEFGIIVVGILFERFSKRGVTQGW